MTTNEKAFQALVLQGIWTIIRILFITNRCYFPNEWRASAIAHMDLYGNQSEEAAKYRRETSYPELK